MQPGSPNAINRDLFRQVHQHVHEAMASGLRPRAVCLGWQQYGELWRLLCDGLPDGARPREVLDLPVVLAPVRSRVQVLV